ncbi:type I secretion outer membrane protein, TolC family [Desulfurispirillum indicum S5]|uniref:Type I secretion outer membrane protein, TolC family n=1 Tax=Desulfurispirillum indicum (strain ATCC BAA-1389 / DSM 22839 / S5) TaxID=653733 RepID=E6W638_DESIS|nr:TolC family outer membrane protein [Desulfurispirillum indicum]ADU64977.1 type I secretion outer membrane protein, TolC family [Desulfurispirillum indicum S5]
MSYLHNTAKIFLSILMILYAGNLAASEVLKKRATIDLLGAYSLALENDSRYQGSIFKQQATQTYRAQGRAGLLPQLYGRASFTKTRDLDADFNKNQETSSYGLTLRQPMLNLESYHRYRQISLQADGGDIELRIAEAELKVRVAQVYFQLLAAFDHEQLLEAEHSAIEQQLQQTRSMQRRGQATIADVNEVYSELLSVESRIVEARSQRKIAQTMFERITGVTQAHPARLAHAGEYVQPQRDLGEWLEVARRENLGVLHQKLELEIAGASVKVASARYAPTIDLIAQYVTTDETSDMLPRDKATVLGASVQLNVPLYSGGSTRAAHREAQAEESRARSNFDEALREAAQQVTDAYLQIQGASARISSLKRTIEASEVSLISMQRSVEAGVRTPVDVMYAKRSLFSHRNRLLQAQYDYIIGQLALYFHAGMLTGEHMAQMNDFLESNSQRGEY